MKASEILVGGWPQGDSQLVVAEMGKEEEVGEGGGGG